MPSLENVSEEQMSEFVRDLGEKLGRIAEAYRAIVERTTSRPPSQIWPLAVLVAERETTIEEAITRLKGLPTPLVKLQSVSQSFSLNFDTAEVHGFQAYIHAPRKRQKPSSRTIPGRMSLGRASLCYNWVKTKEIVGDRFF
jgi:hypothetical protein